MLIGIDVSHPDPSQADKPSLAAVVGSMDGRLSQYVAHLSAQSSRTEMVSALEDAIVCQLEAFRSKNASSRLPETIVVYRDGVSEGQFQEVLDKELPAIHGAFERLGVVDLGKAIKVAIIVCQKRHHTRLCYEERDAGGQVTRINSCPGVVIDARSGEHSITSAVYNEFYLNSHTAIQGTAKACKYTLLYDEIGFKLSELELLTYWSTYLYARCNRSVSYATPAYYAHWASKRCKDLFASGATDEDLREITTKWSRPGNSSSMFFI
jgi:eukaryotic translation initiation factor 2C